MFRRKSFIAALLLSWTVMLPVPLWGQTIPIELSSTSPIPTPLQDDATLRCIASVGQHQMWTAGDRSTVFQSRDGGRTWRFVPLPASVSDFTITSICFLTDRVGWVSGGRVSSGSAVPQGILLQTRDGGMNWQVVGSQRLPYLHQIRFFDEEQGIASCEPTVEFPGGLLTTTDGGTNWLAVESARRVGWTAASFFGPVDGILAGPRGLRGVLSNGRLNVRSTGTGLRGFRALAVDRSGIGWMAGDGGTLLKTEDAGATWSVPPATLPQHLQDYCEFLAASCVGEHVWLAGIPGSVIWHSPDGGATWERQFTGHFGPLRSIRFIDLQQGCAVGDLGAILITENGGQTWQAVRGADRRVALLTVHGAAQQIPCGLLSRFCLEDGYRSASILLTRRDIGPDEAAYANLPVRLQHSVLAAGGSSTENGWRLPLSIPGIDRDPVQLTREWSLLTDSRLADVFLSHLTARIRMWRPSVIVIDEPGSHDAVAMSIQEAMKRSVQLAADVESFPDQQACGLQPWRVDKVFVRRIKGSTGSTSVVEHQVLPRTGRLLSEVVADAQSRLGLTPSSPLPEQFQLLAPDGAAPDLQSGRTLFGDLNIPPDCPARRVLPPLNDEAIAVLIRQNHQQQLVAGLSRRMIENSATAPTLLAQLADLVAPLSPTQAAQQLADMAREHRAQGQLDLAEDTYAQLLESYGNQPAALEARRWLVNHWTSLEVNWQRLRTQTATRSVTQQVGGDILRAHWEAGLKQFQEAETATARALVASQLPSAVQSREGPLALTITSGGASANQAAMHVARWQELANLMLEQIVQEHPEVWDQPQTQFAYAALMRRRLRHQQADKIYDHYLRQVSDDPWHLAARGETWLLHRGPISPKPVLQCRIVTLPPVLDGLLSDPCWGQAAEVKLSAQGESDPETFVGAKVTSEGAVQHVGPQGIVMLCYDSRFLYIAASIPRLPEAPSTLPEYPGRVYDADLSGHDRILVHLDVDRDYNTYYTFAIDQRGWTNDSCWEDRAYNPRWFVAAQGDERHWRIEAAIPMEELTAQPPTGETWTMGITRIIPGLGHETWTNAGAEIPDPARFGMLQFLP